MIARVYVCVYPLCPPSLYIDFLYLDCCKFPFHFHWIAFSDANKSNLVIFEYFLWSGVSHFLGFREVAFVPKTIWWLNGKLKYKFRAFCIQSVFVTMNVALYQIAFVEKLLNNVRDFWKNLAICQFITILEYCLLYFSMFSMRCMGEVSLKHFLCIEIVSLWPWAFPIWTCIR